MTTTAQPLTDAELAAIAARANACLSEKHCPAIVVVVPRLLAEVARLNAALAEATQ